MYVGVEGGAEAGVVRRQQAVSVTSFHSALVFLRLNGRALHVPGKELFALTLQVATGDVGDQVVAAYIRSRMEPE